MKKGLLLAMIIILGLINVNAQEVEYGIKGGLNFATLNGDKMDDIEPVTAFNLGVYAEIRLSDKFSIQPELIYSGQGYSIGKGDDNLTALGYLNIPLMAKYYLTKGVTIEAGPQVGFLLFADNDGDVKDDFNNVDFGINVGLGYKLENGLNFGLRYNAGLSNVFDTDDYTNKNGVLQFSVGYTLF